VARPHGIRGEVAVEVRTDDPGQRFAVGSVLDTDPATLLTLLRTDRPLADTIDAGALRLTGDAGGRLRGSMGSMMGSMMGSIMKTGDAARHGWLAAPLLTRDGRNLGLIQLSHKMSGEFSEDDEAILVQLTRRKRRHPPSDLPPTPRPCLLDQ